MPNDANFSRIWFVKMQHVRALGRRSEFTQSRAHEPCLRPYDLRRRSRLPVPRCQRGHGIDYDHVRRVRAHEGFANPGASSPEHGLGHEQIVKIDTESFRVCRIERVFDIDKAAGRRAFDQAITVSVSVVLPDDSGQTLPPRVPAENRRLKRAIQSECCRWG